MRPSVIVRYYRKSAITLSLRKVVIFGVRPQRSAFIFNIRMQECAFIFLIRGDGDPIIFELRTQKHASQYQSIVLNRPKQSHFLN
jgi:hypothetical protein